MPVIPFAEWRPDVPALGQWAREALNVIPLEESYGPLAALATVTGALSARCQGAAWFRAPANVVKTFAGDATKLYLLSGTAWSDVSGSTYTLGPDGQWRFAQFGTLAVAVNGVDPPQKFDLASATSWAALAGTNVPTGIHIATVRDFLVIGNIGTTQQRVQWSPFNDAEGTWGSFPATQADYQDLPDGGNINGLVGGEIGLILQEAAVRRMSYEGSPTVFRIDKIADGIGCSVPGSVASVLDRAFFVHKSGFYMVVAGQQVVPIGRGKVDRTFWADLDETFAFMASATIDPVRGLYVMAYPSTTSATGTPDKLLIYNWRTERWSHAEVSCELVFGGVSQQGYTLEELDAFGTMDTLPYSLDSGYWTGTVSLRLFAFTTAHIMSAFTGAAMEATLETAEFMPLSGKRSIVRGCRPLIDGSRPQIQLGVRERQQASVTYGTAVELTGAGLAPVYNSGRYFRVRATIPSLVEAAAAEAAAAEVLLAPDTITGLIRAWDFRTGVTLTGGKISSVAGAWGTTVAATQATAGNRPTIDTAFGPNADDVANFDAGSTTFLSFTATDTLTEFTAAFVLSIEYDGTNHNALFGNSGTNASSIRLENDGILGCRPHGDAATTEIEMPGEPYALIQPTSFIVLMVKYTAAAGGSLQAYINGNTTAAATSITSGFGDTGFIFNQFGLRGGATQPFNGHVSAILLYERWLSDEETDSLNAYLMQRAAVNYYVGSTGDDTTTTPWNSTTPFATLSYAAELPWIGDQVIAVLDTLRTDEQLRPAVLPISGATMTIDGDAADSGTNKQVRFSKSPTPSVTTGTIYDMGIVYGADVPILEPASCTAGFISGTTLTVAGTIVNKFRAGQTIDGTGVTTNSVIVEQLTNTNPDLIAGKEGTYSLTQSSTVAATTITGGGGVTRGTTTTIRTDGKHFLTTGDYVLISDVAGTVELNGNTYQVTVVDTLSFTLDGIDSTTYGAYTGSGTVNAIVKPHIGTASNNPTNYVYYVPGGTYNFTGSTVTGYEVTNVVRLTEAASATNAPASGEWSQYTDHHIYVNAGVALSAGDIEIPIAPSNGANCVACEVSGWNYQNLDILFSDARAFGASSTAVSTLTNVRVMWHLLDGIDAFDTADITCEACVAAYIGAGLALVSGGGGDGYSFHNQSTGTFNNCKAILCDKDGFSHSVDTTTVNDGALVYGRGGFWYASDEATIGSYTVQNAIVINPDGMAAYGPWAFKHNASQDVASPGTPTMRIYNCTAISLSTDVDYVGIRQEDANARIIGRNLIFVGYNTVGSALVNGSKWRLSRLCISDCGSTPFLNFSPNTSGFVYDDPAFTNSPSDLSIPATSPVATAGEPIAGVTTDYAGTTRSIATPSIGAYEAPVSEWVNAQGVDDIDARPAGSQ